MNALHCFMCRHEIAAIADLIIMDVTGPDWIKMALS